MLVRPDGEHRHRQALENLDAVAVLVHRGLPFGEDAAVEVLPWSFPASDSDWEAFRRREVCPVPVDLFYRVALRAALEEVLVVDLAVVVPAVGASTAEEMVHPVVLPGTGSTVASDTAAEFRRNVELGFARPVAC